MASSNVLDLVQRPMISASLANRTSIRVSEQLEELVAVAVDAELSDSVQRTVVARVAGEVASSP